MFWFGVSRVIFHSAILNQSASPKQTEATYLTQAGTSTMSRHRNIRNLTEDDYDDYYVSRLFFLFSFRLFVYVLIHCAKVYQPQSVPAHTIRTYM